MYLVQNSERVQGAYQFNFIETDFRKLTKITVTNRYQSKPHLYQINFTSMFLKEMEVW